MRICIMAQEEPVCFSPFLRKIIQAKSKDIVLVIMAGARGAGNHPRNLKKKWESLLTLWLIWEPKGFLKSLGIKIWFAILSSLGLIGTQLDARSVSGVAKKLNIHIFKTDNVNSNEALELLREKKIDVIINQGEVLLKQEILDIPKKGIINRHASLLPHFRGRVGSFWSHANEPPEYGVTIHFVDQEIDSGQIIEQKQFDLDNRLPYSKIIEKLFEESVPLMLEALDKLNSPDFTPLPNNYKGTNPYLFPKLEDAKEYCKVMRKRRS